MENNEFDQTARWKEAAKHSKNADQPSSTVKSGSQEPHRQKRFPRFNMLYDRARGLPVSRSGSGYFGSEPKKLYITECTFCHIVFKNMATQVIYYISASITSTSAKPRE
ncbi:MAG: hypothetical protein M1813_006066 [Trichoglossum hirsutum]|nr:MAG: hypothetical protein M1813_006066 [Trichoglossum hirsutum]